MPSLSRTPSLRGELKEDWHHIRKDLSLEQDSKKGEEDLKSLTSGHTRGGGKSLKSGSLPYKIDATPVCRHVFAFSPGGSAAYSMTVQGLLNMCGGYISVVNSTFRPWASSVKIHKITIWPPSQTGDYSVSDIWWANGFSSFIPDKESIRPIPADITASAALEFTPPKDSLASNWLNANLTTTAVAVVQSNAGAVIYIDVSFTLTNVNTSGSQTVATGALGQAYYLSPDPATFQLRPIALSTTH